MLPPTAPSGSARHWQRAGAVIIDLEDVVAPAAKDTARAAVSAWLAQHSGPAVVLRINAAGTPWFEADLALCARGGVAAVMVPKAVDYSDLLRVADSFGGKPLLPLIETAAGFD